MGKIKTGLISVFCLAVAVSLLSCAKKGGTTLAPGHLPAHSTAVTEKTEMTQVENTTENAGDDNDGEDFDPRDAEGDCGADRAYPTPQGPIPTIGPLPTLPVPDVTLRPTPEAVGLPERYEHTGMNISLELPEGYHYESGTSKSARFTAEDKTIEFTLLVQTGRTSGGDLNNIRTSFYHLCDLIHYRQGDEEYKGWDIGIQAIQAQMTYGTVKAVRDILSLEMLQIEGRERATIMPYALATYFDLGQNSYILVVIGEPEDAAVMELFSNSIMASVKEIPETFDLGRLPLETVTDTQTNISFSLPAGWEKIDTYDRLIYRPKATENSPLYDLQVTCFRPTESFTVSYEAPTQIPQKIYLSYLKNPRSRYVDPARVTVNVIGYKDVRLEASGIYVNRYLLETKLLSITTNDDRIYVQDNGVIESYMYTFETSAGEAYAINLSSAISNRYLRNELAELINRTLVIG